jgi:site-specific DNA recombinase
VNPFCVAEELEAGFGMAGRQKVAAGGGCKRCDCRNPVGPTEAVSFAAVKGIVYSPSVAATILKPEARDALLNAIAKARRWIDDLRQGRRASFAEIAQQEGQVERHIRLPAPLAFVSPRIVSAIVEGTAPGNLTVTGLARALPYSWVEQAQASGRQ